MYRRILGRLKGIGPTQLRQVVLGVTGLGVGTLLAVHFVMTALILQPDNPFRDQVYPWVNAYMAPYFSQNWRLFAPDPEEPTKHIAVACRFSQSGREDSPVFDITQPHYEALQAHRLSASQRIIRAQVYPLTLVHPPKDHTLEAMEKLATSENPDDRALAATLEKAKQDSRDRGMKVMGRVASVECQRRYPDDAISEVDILYYHEKAPKFSQRNSPDARGEDVTLDYGWQPYQQVALY